MGNAGRVRESVHIFEVLLRDLEWTSGDVGNVLADQLAGINGGLVDLLQQEGTEGLHARTQESTVERHVNSSERNGGEASLKHNRLGLRFGLLDTLLDDLDKVGLDILQRHALHESGNVDVLCLEVVQQVGEAVKCAKLDGEVS